MRILFLTHYFPPEVNAPAARTVEHCTRWAAAGHDVTVVTCEPNCPAGVLYEGYRNTFRSQVEWVEGVRVVRVWTYLAANAGRVRRILNYLSYMFSATWIALGLPRPDVVVATSPQFFCGWAGVFVSRLKQAPLVLEIRDIWPASIEAVGALRSRPMLWLLRLLERWMYGAAEQIVAVGEGYRRKILERADVGGRIEVITNGVDLRRFAPAEPDSEFLGRWGLQGKFVCSYVGTIGMAHGLEVVLDAARLLKQKGRDDVSFCLVGDGAARKTLEDQANRLDLGDRVVFCGRQPREAVPTILASSSVCLVHLRNRRLFDSVLPSKIFETMAMGRPIILGVRGEGRDVVMAAGGGIEIEPDSAESLAGAVERLMDDPELAVRLARSAREYVARHFDRDQLASRYLVLLERVAALRERPNWSLRLERWWYVLRYHRPSQLVRRTLRIIKQRLARWTRRRAPTARTLPGSSSPQALQPSRPIPVLRENPCLEGWLRAKLASRPDAARATAASRILEGRFRFLNEERRLPDPIDWRLLEYPGTPRLWRFHLHYHEFLLDLMSQGAAVSDRRPSDRAWAIVRQWIEANRRNDPLAREDAWHPYCISRRLPMWLLLWTAAPPQTEFAGQVFVSLSAQADFLSRNLERDLGGNHLFENAVALVLVGAFFGSQAADRWLREGADLLGKQISEQILPHGEHFERSPMYHVRMLELLLDVRDAVRTVNPKLAERCSNTAAKMAAFLRHILHPDGEIPLFGDSGVGEMPVGLLLHRAGIADFAAGRGNLAGPSRDAEDSSRHLARAIGDYWVFRDGGDFLLFDAGPVGPDHLPAHAHADLLSLEVSVRGRRLFVDSGTFGYQDDWLRQYCRSTAAHNVLQIDGREQCDVWDRFRMGYRGRPGCLETGQSGGFAWARCWHDANRPTGVARTWRWIACRPGGPWFIVDGADGGGGHRIVNRLHLHPQVQATNRSPNEVELNLDGDRLTLGCLSPGRMTVHPGWYCPEFGAKFPSQVVEWEADRTSPLLCGWYLYREIKEFKATLDDGEIPVLRWDEGGGVSELYLMSARGSLTVDKAVRPTTIVRRVVGDSPIVARAILAILSELTTRLAGRGADTCSHT